MLYFSKLVVLISIFILNTIYAKADDIWRLRYLAIASSDTEINRNNNRLKNKLETSGNSGNLVFFNGVGLGYNTLRKKGIIEGVYYKFKNQSFDLSYTIGEFYSCTFGVGGLVYGRGELTYNGNNFVTENSKGGSFFLDFGIPFLVGELLFGYRKDSILYTNFQTQISGESIILEENLKLSSSLFNIGLGFLF